MIVSVVRFSNETGQTIFFFQTGFTYRKKNIQTVFMTGRHKIINTYKYTEYIFKKNV